MMNNAPVILFVYNRPVHTRCTVEALKKNKGVSDTDLFIFSDGPGTQADTKAVQETRKYIHAIDGFRHIHVIERQGNAGLANSIIEGVTEIVNSYGKAIILEDDLATSPYFLHYMNQSLRKYEDISRVMQISAFQYLDINCPTDSFLFRRTSSWGWATWKDRWEQFNPNTNELIDKVRERSVEHFNIDNAVDRFSMLLQQQKGEIDSWAIRWAASVFLKDGLVAWPRKTLVVNIGHDGSGVHCTATSRYDKVLDTDFKVKTFQDQIEENRECLAQLIKYYRSNNGFLVRLKRKLKNIIKKI